MKQWKANIMEMTNERHHEQRRGKRKDELSELRIQ